MRVAQRPTDGASHPLDHTSLHASGAPTVLLIDDDPATQLMVAAILAREDCRLVCAGSAMEGLRSARELVPDLILLDIVMPDLDGFEVCRQLRQDRILAEVPIIMATGLEDRDSRIAGLDAGADDFMLKPVDPMELRARVRTVLRLDRYRRLLQERRESVQLRGQLSKTRAALIRAQKIEALAVVAGGVAHDFNNILTVTGANAALILQEPSLPPDLAEAVREIEQAAVKGGRLVRQLMALSRRGKPDLKAADVNAIVEDTASMLRRIIGDEIRLDCGLCTESTTILADPGMVQQVVLNLALNARDAMESGGTLSIRTDIVSLSAAQAAQFPTGRPGTWVRLTVEDTGIGIPPDLLPHIFDPFVTTKDPGRGTGLGLATVAAIMERHDAWVDAHSVPGSGTRFRVHFPSRDLGVADDDEPREIQRAAGGAETVLLVEDEDAVRNVMQSVLTRRGYQVLTAGTAQRALDIWNEAPDRIDLLIADVGLPDGHSGLELAEALLEAQPALRVLLCSGSEPAGIPDRPGVHFLDKPFGVETLARVVRSCLDAEIPV